MAKTVIEKVPSKSSGVTVFKITGTLGFHEKENLIKLFDECEKHGISKLVMDFSELTSLGGGCAKIIREKADSGDFFIGVAGASKTTLKFLRNEDEPGRVRFASTVEEAMEEIGSGSGEEVVVEHPAKKSASTSAAKKQKAKKLQAKEKEPKVSARVEADHAKEDEIEKHETDGARSEAQNRTAPDTGDNGLPNVICLGHDANGVVSEESTGEPVDEWYADAPVPGLEGAPIEEKSADLEKSSDRKLKRRLVQYSSLLSISSDFNRIMEKSKLLDTILLTTIAQVGVESAAFFEYREDGLEPIAAKGIELEQCTPLVLEGTGDGRIWEGDEILEMSDSPIEEESKKKALSSGFAWAAPVIIYNEFRGLVLIGKPIKKTLNEDSLEVLNIIVRQAAVAYENTRRFEEESERILGLVQSLISLIEERTLARGNTSLIAGHSYMLAKKMHYPDELIKDLMFGVVLRDIGMIKVSDLIVRSPRELGKEEWEIIKRHPIDGADMLRKMKFSDHAVKIVLCHHERYNGEGYPNQLRGGEIPLGARIVSVVESYGAMLQDRPTRPALTREEALNTLKENWGMRYDPEVVEQFVEIIEEEIRTGENKQYMSSEFFSV
ncbi:MAG: HD domain-containing protein [Candidatus Latescibacteria bacterium]|nr:HD domain-containing protein [Candidatus Latescibacterota bacterium]NIM66406.1 HD domain-containing protein [Candidatus Latescibacterota bacterium]NIO02885.1 HD domain-containing protein [Candidatus Latescibacterota bacterium]NIO30020.1 HD domain-containing protein [Candidatus Latescibacterota bacterium]NIO57635.1 HD domain-containing protein [Candidatus Latescibacterota bacterium]